MKSIRMKILLSMILTVLISLTAVGGISCYLNYSSTVDTLEKSMIQMAKTGSQRVEKELTIYEKVAYEVGSIPTLSDPAVSIEEKAALLKQRADSYNFQRGNLLGLDGVSLLDGNDYSERSYFQTSLKGETAVSEPLISKITGEVTIIVSAPLWEKGEQGGKVAGVIYFVPKESFLNDIATDLHISEGGSAYMLDKNGYTIAHKNMENVKNQENTQEDALADKSLEPLAVLEKQMTQGGSGFGLYTYGGLKKLLAYSPIAGTNGWSIGINVPLSDFTGSTINGVIITVILLILSLIVATVIAYIISKRIGDPIKACADRMQKLSKGDIDTPVLQVNSRDETFLLASSAQELVTGFRMIIKDVDHMLSSMAGGNLNVASGCEDAYVGGFNGILVAMQRLTQGLTDTLEQINHVADQVAAGADQVSSGAQALSQGATEQASSVEELAATINGISTHVEENARNAKETSSRTMETSTELEVGRSQMENMTEAMGKINYASGEIGKIIKTIEDIAFQTNILALNAAVEAARAGQAGKGFAVVADEVRSLASKSAEASKNTAELIESTIKAVEEGNEIAKTTAASLERVVILSEQNSAKVEEIAKASGEQAGSISQVTLGIDQISSVVQNNSATAEESAAASEELSGQASLLKELIERFKLKSDK